MKDIEKLALDVDKILKEYAEAASCDACTEQDLTWYIQVEIPIRIANAFTEHGYAPKPGAFEDVI